MKNVKGRIARGDSPWHFICAGMITATMFGVNLITLLFGTGVGLLVFHSEPWKKIRKAGGIPYWYFLSYVFVFTRINPLYWIFTFFNFLVKHKKYPWGEPM
jgi:hypothetical protein